MWNTLPNPKNPPTDHGPSGGSGRPRASVFSQRKILFRQFRSAQRRLLSDWDVWGVRIVAVLTALMGLVNVVSAVSPYMAGRFSMVERISPLEVRVTSRLTVTLAGFALLLLAVNLGRRKQVAWTLTIFVLAVSALGHVLKGPDYKEAASAAALATILLLLRPHFHARSDPPSVRHGLMVIAASVAFTVIYGVIGFSLLDGHFHVRFNLWTAFLQTVAMFTQFGNSGLVPLTRFGRYFAGSIYVVGVGTLGYGLLSLIRPVLIRYPATTEERVRAKSIVQSFGRTCLARFALFDDISYFFSPGGSTIAFMVKGRTALGLGDPIGPDRDALPAFRAFADYCGCNDWQACLYQAAPDLLEEYRAAGFRALCIGQEAVVDLKSFTLKGHAAKELRNASNHLTRLGYRAEMHPPPLDGALLAELREISDEWLILMRGSEMGFAMGRFDEEYLRSSPVMVIRGPEGQSAAFANLIPESRRREIAVDLMRRRANTENGTMEFLFASVFAWAARQGYDSFNLGLSGLSGVGQEPDDPAAERALRFLYENANWFYNFKGLRAFKEKFHPRWEPRYLIYPGIASLPAAVTALVRAGGGDDFLWGFLRGNG